MASLGGLGGSEDLDISRMSDSEKREFQQFVQNESQKAGIQESAYTRTHSTYTPVTPSHTLAHPHNYITLQPPKSQARHAHHRNHPGIERLS